MTRTGREYGTRKTAAQERESQPGPAPAGTRCPKQGAAASRHAAALPAGTAASLPAYILVAVFIAVAGAPLAAALVVSSRGGGLLEGLGTALAAPVTARALSFALRQALASTILALFVGLPGAWLCSRYDFPGRRLLKALSVVPFCVPPILIVLAFVVYYGRAGILNRAIMGALGLTEPPITFLYSFWGLVLVHGFYNFPVILQGVSATWSTLPRDREEAARTLGAKPFRAFLSGSLPSLAPSIIQSATLVFLFCFFSFIPVLVFGPLGGTTLEVEIYRAARFDGKEELAAALSLIETVAALGMVFIFQLMERRKSAAARKAGSLQKRGRPRGGAAAALVAYGALVALFFAGPLLSLVGQAFVVKRGLGGASRIGLGNFTRLLSADGPLLPSILDSLATALPAAIAASIFGSLLAVALRGRKGGRAGEALVTLPLAVSGIVSALGWSIIAPTGSPAVVVLALAATALPFSLRNVSSSLATLDQGPSQAARSLGAGRLRTALEIDLPSIAPALLSAAAFSFSLTAGDANAPLILGSGGFQPLPVLIYRLVAAYRFPEASAVGLVLALLTGFVFFIKEQRDGRT